VTASNDSTAEPADRRRRRRIVWTTIAVVGAAVIAAALVLFQPWLLVIDVRVDDDIPSLASPSPAASPTAVPTDAATTGPSATPEPRQPVELARGSFISHEHETTGTALIIEQPDGSRVLALEGLSTTNGPDVHVWLSAGPVVEGFDGWFTAGGYDHVDLGMIKGNVGDQIYEIPPEVDLSAYPTVDLWCVQFAVSFGAASLSTT
jgi:hypothetical protein